VEKVHSTQRKSKKPNSHYFFPIEVYKQEMSLSITTPQSTHSNQDLHSPTYFLARP